MRQMSNEERRRQAQTYFAEGYNCAQAVAMVFAQEAGLPVQTLSRLLSGLGGGMGGMGHTCGVVNGAAVAISAIMGAESLEGKARNLRARKAVGTFVRRFEGRYGKLTCTGLLGVDVTHEMAREEARAVGVHRLNCPGFVAEAVKMAWEIVSQAEE